MSVLPHSNIHSTIIVIHQGLTGSIILHSLSLCYRARKAYKSEALTCTQLPEPLSTHIFAFLLFPYPTQCCCFAFTNRLAIQTAFRYQCMVAGIRGRQNENELRILQNVCLCARYNDMKKKKRKKKHIRKFERLYSM